MSIFKTAALVGVYNARAKIAKEAIDPGDAADLLAEEGTVPSEEVSLAKRLLGAGGGALAGDVAGLLASGLLHKTVPRLGTAAALLGPAAGAGMGSALAGGSDLEALLAAAGAGAGGVAGKGLGLGALMVGSTVQGKKNQRRWQRQAKPYLYGGLAGGTIGGLAGGAAGAGVEALRDDEG